MGKRLKRFLIVSVAVGIGLPIVLGVVWYVAVGIHMHRAEAIAFYRDALQLSYYRGIQPPEKLIDLVASSSPELAAYMSGQQDPENPLPDYRPATHLKGGPYLVIVEKPPQRWYNRGRYVVYAYPNGKPAEASMGGIRYAASIDELRRWLAEDDARRDANGAASSPATSAPAG